MAKRGAKAKPDARHKLEGTTHPSRHKGEEPDPGGAIGEPPDHLPEEAKEFWRNAARWLNHMRIGKECDELHLEAASMLWYRLREANRALVAEGAFQTNKNSGITTRTAAATEATQCTEKLRMWYNEVGFVPSARASMRIPEGADGSLEDRIFGKGKKPALKAS